MIHYMINPGFSSIMYSFVATRLHHGTSLHSLKTNTIRYNCSTLHEIFGTFYVKEVDIIHPSFSLKCACKFKGLMITNESHLTLFSVCVKKETSVFTDYGS